MARTWLRLVAGNLSSPAFLLRALVVFPKAVLAAESMRREGVGHVHAHYATHPALAAWVIHRLTGIPYSITVHAHDIFVRQAMLRRKVEDAAFVVAISEFNRSFLMRLLGSGVADKIAVIHCGVDPAKYRPRAAAAAGERLELLTIASLQPYKGLAHLVRACAELHARGVRYRCRIVGEGGERPRLEKLIRALGLTGQVELLGGLPQEIVQRLLPEADCYVQPSVVTPAGKMEGIPVAIMEALACEVPVVATAISGVPELVEDGVTGRLVPPAQSAALAAALIEVDRDRATCRGRARLGRARVVGEFNLQRNVARLAELLGASAPRAVAEDSPRPAA
jgi:glycosyltransferase involved in cell wall biosynthesis